MALAAPLGLLAAWMVGPATAAVVLLVAGVVTARRLRRGRTAVPADDLGLAIDVLAACLEAGTGAPAALEAAALAAAPARAAALRSAAAALGRGGGRDAWKSCLADPDLAPAARICARSERTGAAAAADLRQLAATHRSAVRAARRRAGERASVWVVLPLGLCFLPAFVLVALVPLVATLLPPLT
jgi:pilus assembly protein TadC